MKDYTVTVFFEYEDGEEQMLKVVFKADSEEKAIEMADKEFGNDEGYSYSYID